SNCAHCRAIPQWRPALRILVACPGDDPVVYPVHQAAAGSKLWQGDRMMSTNDRFNSNLDRPARGGRRPKADTLLPWLVLADSLTVTYHGLRQAQAERSAILFVLDQ